MIVCLIGGDSLAAQARVGAVALSNVAKYWVLTNLFPGPIPQVTVPVYGLPPPPPPPQPHNQSRVSIFYLLI